MSNLNDIFFTPAANQELTYDQVLEDVQRYFAENHASTIAEAGEGNAERATSLLKELMEHYIVKRKYADGSLQKNMCSKLYEDMAGYSFLKKWIYKPGIEEVNINAYNDIEVIEPAAAASRSRTSFLLRNTPLMWCGVCSTPAHGHRRYDASVVGFLDKTSVSPWIRPLSWTGCWYQCLHSYRQSCRRSLNRSFWIPAAPQLRCFTS